MTTVKSNWAPLEWNQFYHTKKYCRLQQTNYTINHCYYTCQSTNNTPDSAELTYVLLHGAGQTSLSFACTAAQLYRVTNYNIVAFDCRYHGDTTIQYHDNNIQSSYDLSIDTLVNDTIQVITNVIPANTPIVLVGHSMGASIVINTSYQLQLQPIQHINIQGCIIIDLVETAALASIDYIKQSMNNRPTQFQSISGAIEWCIRSDVVRNITSACVSIPSQLHYNRTYNKYEWITNLQYTVEYWVEWFTHLSDRLIQLKCRKLLIVANTDRLDDKVLMIAQMQGKIQVECIRDTTHSIQEDKPVEVARLLSNFVTRHIQR